jgi:hypothetical protein
MAKKNKTDGLTTVSAQKLHSQMQQMATEGYVAMPVRRIYGNRVDTAGPQWKDIFNTLLGAGPDGNTASPAAGAPVGMEIPVEGGTKGLGYIAWGNNNRFPNQMALLSSMLPYTAVGVKFNADVIAGLGPRPKYRYNRYVNGGVQTERIDYSAAGALLQGQLADKRKALLDFYAQRAAPKTDEERKLQEDMVAQLRKEITEAEEAYGLWRTTNEDVKAFMENTNHNLFLTSLANDMSLVGICFPEVQLDRQGANKNDASWNPKIIALNFHSCCKCRLERRDESGKINFVYVSNQWMDKAVHTTNDDYQVAAVPALDPHRPLQSLQDKVRNVRLSTLNGKRKTVRPTHFFLPCYYPSVGREYYPELPWHSIIYGDVYKYTSTIIENRRIAKENSNSAGKIIYIHTDYLSKLYQQMDVKTQEDREKLRDEMWDEINNFLKDKNNNGQTILSFTFTGTDGKEHDAWRIVDVPLSSKNEADANKTELEELSNIIFLSLGIHSILIGNNLSSASSGGTQQREMYEMKKLFSMPTQLIMLAPYNLARDFNGWDSHLEWEVSQMTLTTLDRNKNGLEETKV